MRLRPDARYRADNILQLQPELPYRSTHGHQGPDIAASVAAVLDGALREDDDIVVDASNLNCGNPAQSAPTCHGPAPLPFNPASCVSGGSRIPKPSRPRSAKTGTSSSALPRPSSSGPLHYPLCRGLVPK
ncbi:hypothetical protein GJAV_G00175370 [Gymnothorax javanicus]|nr:hypothetical protein GJAV_G00175370 [Gymnothorax javanicus]